MLPLTAKVVALTVVALCVALTNRAMSQHSIDSAFWLSTDFQESQIWDMVEFDDALYFLSSSRHSYLDSTRQDRLVISKLDLPVSLPLTPSTVLDTSYGHNMRQPLDLVRFNDHWIVTTIVSNGPQDTASILFTTYNSEFQYVSDTAYHTHNNPASYYSLIKGDTLVGIGNVLYPPDSLFRIMFNAQDIHNPRFVKFRTDPWISFISSIVYEDSRNRYVAYHLGGLATFDLSFNIIDKFNYMTVQTSQHGGLLTFKDRLFSFGCSWKGFERNLVFQEYDPMFQILSIDTLGDLADGADNYPFIRKSIDSSANHVYIGGMLNVPPTLPGLTDNIGYFVAKYDDNNTRVWLKTLGGSHPYYITGLEVLDDGTIAVYGSRRSHNDGLPYGFIVILSDQGEILTSSEGVGAPSSKRDDLFRVYPNPTSGIVTVESNGPLLNACEMALYDISGKKLASFPIRKAIEAIDLSQGTLSSGTYIYTIQAVATRVNLASGKIAVVR